MKFELACNWDRALLEGLNESNGRYGPVELFGGIPGGIISGGRASFVAPEVTEADAADYIKAAREMGHTFNFLLNASCLDNREYRKDEFNKILKHIEWVAGTGAESVTVAIPYLLQIIKKHFPGLRVNVSSWARVESVRRAQFFEEMGADAIVLSEDVNRDFRAIEAIRRAVKCKLILIANPGCLYGCPRAFYHANVMTHGSQGAHASEGFLVDHCYFSCTKDKIKNPVEIIKIRWIRPEDVGEYESLGIDCLKVIDRYKTTEALLGYMKAYRERHFEGNLIEFLNLPRKKAFLPANLKYILRDEYINTSKLMEFADITDYPVSDHIVLDSTKIPANFLGFFKTNDCATADCDACGYCGMIAQKALTVDGKPLLEIIHKYEALLESLVSGSIYNDDEPVPVMEMNSWDKGAEEIHKEIIERVPGLFRKIAAKRVVGEITAKANGGRVSRRMVIDTWLSATPGPFKKDIQEIIGELTKV